VVAAFAECPKEVKLILKKRPHHATFSGFEKRKALQPRKELPKLNLGPKLRRSYGRQSRKAALNSSLDELVSQSSVDRLTFCPFHYCCHFSVTRTYTVSHKNGTTFILALTLLSVNGS